MKTSPTTWVSSVKIIACFMIFIHHYLKAVLVIDSYTISPIVAISLFLFISGFLATGKDCKSVQWLSRKIIRVYVPLVLVLVPTVMANAFLNLKQVAFPGIAIEMLGGALFVERPFYEALWFATLIFGLYFIVYLSSHILKWHYIALGLLLCFYFELIMFLPHTYFIDRTKLTIWLVSFYLGCISLNFMKVSGEASGEKSREREILNQLIYNVSSYSLPFYLVHGPILFVLSHALQAHKELTLLVGLFLSISCAVILDKISLIICRKCSIK